MVDMKEESATSKKENGSNPLGLTSLNHISIMCLSLEKSLDFYQNVVGFFPVRRPRSLNFVGAWLFNHEIGIHLLQVDQLGDTSNVGVFNPKEYHISFQCESMEMVEKKLKEMKIEYVKSKVTTKSETSTDRILLNDPDGFMIEISNCQNLPVVPPFL